MRFLKQETPFAVSDIIGFESSSADKRHGALLPDSMRCLIVGPSNCGKTNLMICLLVHANGLRFRNVYVYSKSLQQPKYVYLKNIFEGLREIGYFAFTENELIDPPEKARPDSIFIFDDIACENMDTVRRYFSMGRHSKVDSFFLCQSYTRVPKHLVRDNANMIVVFKQDQLNLKHIYDDHVGADMAFDTFLKICSCCWNENKGDKYGFMTIDKDSPLNSGRYRKGLDTYISLV